MVMPAQTEPKRLSPKGLDVTSRARPAIRHIKIGNAYPCVSLVFMRKYNEYEQTFD